MSGSSATLIQFPSFALSDILLPSHIPSHTSYTKHGYHYLHLKQNLSTSSSLFVGYSRGSFRVHSTKGKAPAAAAAIRIAERLSLPAYLTKTLGLSQAEALSASHHLLGVGAGRKQSNVNAFITIKKVGDAISYLQNECQLDLSLSQIKTLVALYPKILSRGADLRKTCTPNITLLQNDIGFTKDRVLKLLFKYPRAFLLKTEMLKDRLVKIEDKWGISRDTAVFLRAIIVFCGTNDERIESRCQVFKSFGFSDSDILRMVRATPTIIGLSAARVRKSLEFCMKELGYSPAYLSTRSTLVSMRVETRLLPRHRVLLVLKENLFLKSSYQLYSCLSFKDDMFVEKFILPYEKFVPNLRQVYNERPSPNSDAESQDEEVSEDDPDH